MEARGSRWPLTGGLGSVLSSSHRQGASRSLCRSDSPVPSAHLRWETLTPASGHRNASCDFPGAVQINLISSLHYSCLQDYFQVVSRKERGNKETREKRNNQSQAPSNTSEPGYQGWSRCSTVQMRVMLREVQKALTHPGFQHYDKSVFPGNALKAAEFVLINALTPVLRPLPKLASGSHSSSCLQKQN